MKYALVNGYKAEPMKGLNGECPCCGGDVVSRCGNYKVHHWAHKSRELCDPWWENESEWHRAWKAHFPIDNQEYVFIDEETGEKHVADIYADNHVIIEFQSYSISTEEITSRENFYKQMIWMIDGCKSEFDKINFNLSICEAHTENPYLRKFIWVGRSKLFVKWISATKHVYIDFGEDYVWHLRQFNTESNEGLVRAYSKKNFVEFFGGSFCE